MKLRLEGNSIRLRVRKSDLLQLDAEGLIAETLIFPNNTVLTYALKTDSTADAINAHFSADALTVLIPLSIATIWATSDVVSLQNTLETGLFILIEKDFPCKDRTDEDKKDTFFELVNEATVQC